MATVLGLQVADLPDGWTPLEAVTVVTCLNDEGQTSALLRITDGLMSWECVGLLEVAKHETLNDNHWVNDEDD